MINAILLIALFYKAVWCVNPRVISDEECFDAGVKRVQALLSQSKDAEFKQEVEHYLDSTFLTTVRYCLGPDASSSSQAFLACILSFSSCPRKEMDIVNWELCACDTLYCILKACTQKWLEQMSMQDLSCTSECINKSSVCLLRQTSFLGKPHTATATGKN